MSRCCLLGLLCLSLTACDPPRTADIMITGGLVWTGLSSGGPQRGAVAIARGKILAVGDSAELARYVGPRTEVVRADGGLVLPGLADAHTHFTDGGFQLASLDLRDAATPQEFVRRIAAFAQTRKRGEWILGGDWDHTLWRGGPLPRHEGVDSGTPHKPLFVNRLGGDQALANAAAGEGAGGTRGSGRAGGWGKGGNSGGGGLFK